MRVLCCVATLALMVLPVQADVAAYCAAYARDFADLSGKRQFNWQRRYDNAEAGCMAQFAPPAAQAEKAAPNRKPKVAKVKVSAAPKREETAEPAQRLALKVPPKLVVGSPFWKAYCKRKYVSWNEKTLTYRSKTGVERKCLVTAN